jgi:hypothetical protein
MTKVFRLQDTQPPSYKYNLNSNIDPGNIPYTGKIPKPSKNVMTASNLPQPAAFNTKEYTDKIYIRDMENKTKELTTNNFKKLISSGEIEAAATRRENKKAAATLQSAVRRKTDMMKKRQLVGEEQLKQMEETQRQIQAAKADKAKKEDIAAKQLQAISKRIKAQSDVSKIKQAKDKIGAAAKRLLTERVDPHYINQIKKTVIMNKPTVGQRLVVNKKSKLVSKKRHDAGVFGYETRQDYLDLAKQYSNVMTKGQKKK